MDFLCMAGSQDQRLLARWDSDAMAVERVECPINQAHVRSGRRLTPLLVILPSTEIQDLVWTWYNECLITERVLGLFRTAGITGFTVRPVHVTRVCRGDARDLPPLHELVVTGWAGMAAERCGIRVDRYYPCCGHTRYCGTSSPAHLIDEARWDGSSIFMIWPLPCYKFCTEQVADLACAHGLTGVRFLRLGDLDLSGGFTPGDLRHWMPEDIATAREQDIT